MPADYVACRDSYIKKGVSSKVAKARCAAWFYKKHGYTVNEAHKKGKATAEDPLPEELQNEDLADLDWELVEMILTDLDKLESSIEAKDVQAISDMEAINMEMLDDLGVVEIVATKVGASAFTGDGLHVTWTKQALKKAEKTWKLTRASVNHTEKEYGKVISSWLDEDDLHMVVKVNDELKGWLKVAGSLIGVSIEATNVKIDAKKLNIKSAVGSGVTFVFPPHVPACKKDEGCGILGSEIEAVPFEPPEAGNLPARGKRILKEVYSKCRSGQDSETPANKEKCAKIAWNAVKKAGYYKEGDKWESEEDDADGTKPYDLEALYKAASDEESGCSGASLGNINEDNKEAAKVDETLKVGAIMAENQENKESAPQPAPVEEKKTVCAKLHEKVVSEKDAEIASLKKSLEEAKAAVSAFEAEKKSKLLESLKEQGLDPKVYETETIPIIEKIKASIEAIKKKEAEAPVESSGATLKGTEQKTEPAGNALTVEEKKPDVDAQLEKSWKLAEEFGYKRPSK